MEKLSLYAELLKFPSLVLDDVSVSDKSIRVKCHVRASGSGCPSCGQISTVVNQWYSRELRDLNMGTRHVYLEVKIRQFYCKDCNCYHAEPLEIADANTAFTHRQKDYMFILGAKQSYTEVAAIVDVSPSTVERVVLDKCAERIDLSARYARVRRLGIDEHSHRKGKKDYLCILTDLDTGTIVDILPDRKKSTLIAHFQGLGAAFCAQITDVACDYWDAYISTAKTCFPQATIILDRFHVVKMLNDCMDSFRKELRQSDKGNAQYKKLKWILYKQYHTLTDKQLDDLDNAFADAPLLKDVYFIREAFHHILDNAPTQPQALKGIQKWTDDIAQKGITVFDPFIKALAKIKEYVANYVIDNLSNAVTEGLNNLIRSVRRTAFGMPSFHNLRLRVLAISE